MIEISDLLQYCRLIALKILRGNLIRCTVIRYTQVNYVYEHTEISFLSSFSMHNIAITQLLSLSKQFCVVKCVEVPGRSRC